jgi:hypothetical protein
VAQQHKKQQAAFAKANKIISPLDPGTIVHAQNIVKGNKLNQRYERPFTIV